MEEEYKLTKVKVAVKLYGNQDPVIEAVRRYEEKPEDSGRRILTKVAKKICEGRLLAKELGLNLQSIYHTQQEKQTDSREVDGSTIGRYTKSAQKNTRMEEIKGEE